MSIFDDIRERMKKRKEAWKAECDRHFAEVDRLQAELEAIRADCPHSRFTFLDHEPGCNVCDDCGKEL